MTKLSAIDGRRLVHWSAYTGVKNLNLELIWQQRHRFMTIHVHSMTIDGTHIPTVKFNRKIA